MESCNTNLCDYFSSITESQNTNLCNLYYKVNRETIIIKDGGNVFKINNPTSFIIPLEETEYKRYSDILVKKGVCFSVSFYPAGYMKGQHSDIYKIELDLGYSNNPPFVKVLEFGYSYGKILIDNIETKISHSGMTGGDGWVDFTNGWHIASNNIEVIEHLIKILSNK